MKQKVTSFFKKHGLMVGIAIVILGGELLLVGRYLMSRYKNKGKYPLWISRN